MTTSSQPGGQEQAPRSASYSNEARDQSRVGMQAHNVIGDVHIYEVQGDLPEDKYRVALNFLDGNMPRRAEELIREAVNAGFPAGQGTEYTGNHVAYHWELAILSGRSFDHLGNSDFDSIETAVGLGDPDTPDGWASALQVISDLVNCLIMQEKLGTVDQAEFGMVIDAYQRLDKPRQDEIRRHLDMILVGGIQDQLDAIYAKEVRTRRLGEDRENRVWKFFQPIPQEPRARAIEEPSISGAQRIKAVSGGSLALAGLVIALYLTAGKSYFWTAVAALLITAGGYAATRFGIARFAIMARLADAEKEHGEHASDSHYSMPTPPAEPAAHDKGDEEDTKQAREEKARRIQFRRRLSEYVDYRFEKEAPRGSKAKDWGRDTARIKEALTNELIGLYDKSPFPGPGAINWLVKWRVKRIAESWRATELHDYRDKLRVSAGTTAAYSAGLAALAAGAGIVLVEMFQEQLILSLAATALAILGGWLLRASMLDVYLVLRHRLPADREASQRRHEEETAQYQAWQELLGDRPSDAQMARWLDYDRMYVKTLAMNQHGLANRDLVAHAVLTEPGYWRNAARVPNGPWRYSSYIVSVFLLTEAGVRLVAVHLNFRAGVVSNQRRDNFRYDAIAKVHVAELGIRFDGGRRHSILLDETDPHPDDHVESLILSQGFRLALVDGQAKDFVVENVDDGLIDRMRELGPERLLELAFDASGVAGALRILEAVAAEGKEWIAQERARRSRRLLDFQRSLGVLPMLTEAPTPVIYELTSTGNDDLTQTADLGVRVRAIKAFATLHAAELQIAVGDELTVLGHDDTAKRIWVRSALGQEGWVPADCIAAAPAR